MHTKVLEWEKHELFGGYVIVGPSGSGKTLLLKELEKELGKKPKVSTDSKNQVIWIETEEFTIIGYYQFDEDTGVIYVEPQTVEFPNDEPDYIDDPIYGKDANR